MKDSGAGVDRTDKRRRRGPLRQLRIGPRLTLSFILVVLLMALGSAMAFLQLFRVRDQAARRLRELEATARPLKRVHAGILAYRDDLERLVGSEEVGRFAADAAARRTAINEDVQSAIDALRSSPADRERREPMLATLATLRIQLASHVDVMLGLAQAGDWKAVRRRLDIDVRLLSLMTRGIAEEIDAELEREQAHTVETIRRVHRQALWTLSATVVLTLLTAAVLGGTVTRSITRPLSRLDAGAQALARGDFDLAVPVGGSDELAGLAAAFNQTASRLRTVYGELQRSAQHFRSLIENASDLIMVIDGAGRIAYASPSSRLVLGESPEGLLGKEIFGLIRSEETADLMRRVLERRTPPGTRAPTEMAFRHADGSTRTLEAVVSDLREDPAVAGVVVNCRDITERKRLQESLHRSEAISAMGSLVAGVAHEVRNPLFGISANLDAFEVVQEAERTAIVAVLRSEVDRLATLMSDLLEYGKPVSERPAPEPLDEVVAQAARTCLSLARRGEVTIGNRVSPGLTPVMMDRARMVQVFQNLIQNAIQHSPRGGSVAIEAEEVVSNGLGWVSCSVIDSGPGFAEEDLHRVFEPFYTRRRGGTGLGLSIVQRIVDLHGGTVVATNRAGGGAAMTVRLPRHPRGA